MTIRKRGRNRFFTRPELKLEGTGRDYTAIWYVLRLCGEDKFPDGRKVPLTNWSCIKPLWIKLGEGESWAKAITFGSSREEMEQAAEDFEATGIVWLDKKNKTASRKKSLNNRS